MKRSEMEEIIACYLNGQCGMSNDGANHHSEELLKFIEKQGMLPPFVPDSTRDEGHVMYCQWEPEDEISGRGEE